MAQGGAEAAQGGDEAAQGGAEMAGGGSPMDDRKEGAAADELDVPNEIIFE